MLRFDETIGTLNATEFGVYTVVVFKVTFELFYPDAAAVAPGVVVVGKRLLLRLRVGTRALSDFR